MEERPVAVGLRRHRGEPPIVDGELAGERHRIATPAGARPEDVQLVVAELVEHFGLKGPVGVTFPGIVQGGVTLSAANVSKSWIGMAADAYMTQGLRRLVSEGLATVNNRHRFVTDFSPEEVSIIFDIRAQHESYAASIAAQKITAAELGRLQAQ